MITPPWPLGDFVDKGGIEAHTGIGGEFSSRGSDVNKKVTSMYTKSTKKLKLKHHNKDYSKLQQKEKTLTQKYN